MFKVFLLKAFTIRGDEQIMFELFDPKISCGEYALVTILS
jgi:hypothetical protein